MSENRPRTEIIRRSDRSMESRMHGQEGGKMSKKLKAGQEIFFIVKDEDKHELSYQKATFLRSMPGGPDGRCLISTNYNKTDLQFNVPRSMIFSQETDVRDHIYQTALLFGWRAAI